MIRKIGKIRTGGQTGVDRAAMDMARKYNIPTSSSVSKGTDVGMEEGISLGKPMCTIAGIGDIDIVIKWLSELPDGIELAVGGPRASECAEAYKITSHILQRVFEKLI